MITLNTWLLLDILFAFLFCCLMAAIGKSKFLSAENERLTQDNRALRHERDMAHMECDLVRTRKASAQNVFVIARDTHIDELTRQNHALTESNKNYKRQIEAYRKVAADGSHTG